MVVSEDMRIAAEAASPGSRIVDAVPLDGGSSAHVVRLTLVSSGGGRSKVVFRQHADRTGKGHSAGVAAKEFRLAEVLVAAGLPVPKALALHRDSTTCGPWLVTEWVAGSPPTASDRVGDVIAQLADFLARLHAVDPERVAGVGLEPIEDPAEVLPGYLPDDENGRSVAAILASGVERRPNPDVVLHGDYWPGNVLFRDGEIAAVLDWEDAALGDPLVDLACARVEIECALGAPASARFTDEYLGRATERGCPVDLHDLPLWDAYVSATALSAMHLWGLTPTDEAERRRTTQRFFASAGARLSLRSRR
ncbi:MAG: phosphotransferase [Actinomycetota bacterium]